MLITVSTLNVINNVYTGEDQIFCQQRYTENVFFLLIRKNCFFLIVVHLWRVSHSVKLINGYKFSYDRLFKIVYDWRRFGHTGCTIYHRVWLRVIVYFVEIYVYEYLKNCNPRFFFISFCLLSVVLHKSSYYNVLPTHVNIRICVNEIV